MHTYTVWECIQYIHSVIIYIYENGQLYTSTDATKYVAHVMLLSSFCRDNRWSCQLTHISEENTVQTQHTVKYPGVHTHTHTVTWAYTQ